METTETLKKKFAGIGAEVLLRSPWQTDFSIDVHGRTFVIRAESLSRLKVLDTSPRQQHLLLLAKVKAENGYQDLRFLCGQDERDYFVATIGARISTVQDAKDALKPLVVLEAQRRHGVRHRKRDRRHTAGTHRQGEWFFVARPELQVDPKHILQHEPIVRAGGGKPHILQEACRTGGEEIIVHIHDSIDVLNRVQYGALSVQQQKQYRFARVDAKVYARGTVRHPDHKTLKLSGWHEVLMNNEVVRDGSRMRFID